MSGVGHDFTRLEMWFALGALVLTIAVSAVLVPVLRKALAEGPESAKDRLGGE